MLDRNKLLAKYSVIMISVTKIAAGVARSRSSGTVRTILKSLIPNKEKGDWYTLSDVFRISGIQVENKTESCLSVASNVINTPELAFKKPRIDEQLNFGVSYCEPGNFLTLK